MRSVQERVVREIRMLHATWRGLETGLRTTLLGHEERKLRHRQGETYGSPRQSSTQPTSEVRSSGAGSEETSHSAGAGSEPRPRPGPCTIVLSEVIAPTRKNARLSKPAGRIFSRAPIQLTGSSSPHNHASSRPYRSAAAGRYVSSDPHASPPTAKSSRACDRVRTSP